MASKNKLAATNSDHYF